MQRGLAVDTGGSWLLPRLVGLAVAKRMVLTGEMLDASRALELGLASHLVEPEAIDAEAATQVEMVQHPMLRNLTRSVGRHR